jgi:hypothetical protein
MALTAIIIKPKQETKKRITKLLFTKVVQSIHFLYVLPPLTAAIYFSAEVSRRGLSGLEAQQHLFNHHPSCFSRLRGSQLQSRLFLIVRFILHLSKQTTPEGGTTVQLFSSTALVGVFHQQDNSILSNVIGRKHLIV